MSIMRSLLRMAVEQNVAALPVMSNFLPVSFLQKHTVGTMREEVHYLTIMLNL